MSIGTLVRSWASYISRILSAAYRRRDLRNLFLLALALRLMLLWESAHQIGIEQIAKCCPDAANYLNMAGSILDGTQGAEKYFFTFGPGFAYFLSLLMVIFGRGYFLLLLINILISSLSSLLVYKLAKDLTGSYAVAIVSGIIVATSFTSITLSCALLSDTLFYLLFAGGLLVFLKAHRSGRWFHFVLAGVIFGAAALVRAIAQFWPLVMIVMSIALVKLDRGPQALRILPRWPRSLAKSATCVLISLVIIGSWVSRNYVVHSIPVLTTSGAIGVAKIAAFAQAEKEQKTLEEVREEWADEYLERTGQMPSTPAERHELLRAQALRALDTYPSEMWDQYLHWTWLNMTAISRYHRLLLPDFKSTLIPLEYKITNNRLNYLCFSLSMLGFLILLWQRRWSLAIVLALIYVYYVPLVGLTTGQGPRIFFPAQIAWAILIAVVLVVAGRQVGRWGGRIWS